MTSEELQAHWQVLTDMEAEALKEAAREESPDVVRAKIELCEGIRAQKNQVMRKMRELQITNSARQSESASSTGRQVGA